MSSFDNNIGQLEKMFDKEFKIKKNKGKYYDDWTLTGKHSRFDKKLCDKYDIPARNKIKEIMGNLVTDNPDIYMQDLIINIPECKYKFLELQVCTQWINKEFPYPNLYVYERKKKYDDNTLYLTMDRYLTKGYLFDYNSFCDTKPVRLKKYSREFVYHIPWYKASLVYIDHIDKETFEFY